MLRTSSRVIPSVLRSTTCAAVRPALANQVRYYSAEVEKDSKPVPQHISAIVDQIAKLNVLEVGQLVKGLKEKLGIEGAVPMMAAGAPAAAAPAAAAPAAAPAPEVVKEKTEFTIKLMKVAENAKYKIIKELREIKPSLSLMETKGLVEKTPSVIMEKVPKEEANKIVNKLKDAGGEAELVSLFTLV